MLRIWLRGLGLTVVLLAASCSPSVPSATPGPATPGPATLLPGDQIVFRVTTAGGLVPQLYYLLESPSLVVYGDGRVLTQASNPPAGRVPARFEVVRSDPASVAALAARAETDGLVGPTTDFGTPRVTDMPTTRVLLHGRGEAVEVNVYAFIEQFESELTGTQQGSRAALRTLIADVSALAQSAPTSDYLPEDVTVFEVPPEQVPDGTAVTWPGPPPESFLRPATGRAVACGHLSGESARTAYEAALANPGGRWTVEAKERVLVVNPIPAFTGC